MRLDLSDHTILVTGASRGIGRATALALADVGATVAVHYGQSRDAAAEVAEQCGHGAQPIQADLTDLTATDRLFGRVVDVLGPVDALVLNAGVAEPTPLEADTDEWHAAWTDTMHVNLRAPELLCRHALPHFRQHGGGRLISIASRAAFRGDTPAYMTYAASKAGLVALTRSVARGFGEDGVRAFTIAPGFVRTDMAQDFIDEYGEAHATSDLALNNLTVPEDVAPFVVFLASGQADHATGATIDVNAGSYVH
ncbi:3-oxoacyl-ACP reductase [Salinibacter sp. 10B]|uniref:SDR family NAD(P)-dependent oxidoreductase n=1 Tax=Salinibacter sp. 10B TaxID=1923971 RepID=UPI000CF534FF|nr:SDR family oxidoreductase [Salinibacter sp. 10B]PQJ34448.1 3-oxoacyl-ACP reductase [Salinibacter sp. 10B]